MREGGKNTKIKCLSNPNSFILYVTLGKLLAIKHPHVKILGSSILVSYSPYIYTKRYRETKIHIKKN